MIVSFYYSLSKDRIRVVDDLNSNVDCVSFMGQDCRRKSPRLLSSYWLESFQASGKMNS